MSNKEEGTVALKEPVEDGTSLGHIETELENLGVSGGATKTVSKAASRSADVTGELMPFVLGQLQASLESIGASGGGSLLRRQSHNGSQPSVSSPPSSSTIPLSQPHPANSSSSGDTEGSLLAATTPLEECLFDSGTESGEDGGGHDRTLLRQSETKQSPPAELSSFMEGLRDTLSREGLPGRVGTKAYSTLTVESDLMQQVEKVLTVLRDSLSQDPQNLKGGPITPDLIALIDRLKVSLQKTPSELEPELPAIVGSPSPPKEQNPSKLPWVAGGAEAGNGGPWKIRAVKKRGLVRSRSIGVSVEEIEEVRRYLEEEAFRTALQKDAPSKNVIWRQKFTQSDNGGQVPSASRRLSSYDAITFPNSFFKPTRTISMENQISEPDPSRSFFTPAEAMQIAVHKAAIQKQVSEEEDRRRSSLISCQTNILPQQTSPVTTGVTRDFTLALPKPYVAPSSSSDEHEGPTGSLRGQLVMPKGSPRSIENVQISLKETGDMPQLQIAITLNTTSSTGQDQSKKRGEEERRGQGEGSSDESSKSFRYRSKTERKRKMKRANIIDAIPPGEIDPEDDEGSENEPQTVKNIMPTTQASLIVTGVARVPLFLDKTKDPPHKPAFLTTQDNYWNNRFSILKTSFESSSQGSSPSLSPVPPLYARGLPAQAPAHAHLLFNNTRDNIHSPTKPVWATSPVSVGPKSLTGVKTKLSVFESRCHEDVTGSLPSAHIWSVPNRNSAIFQKRESIERKLAEEGSVCQGQLLSRRSVVREFEPEGVARGSSLSERLSEGVHTVHATKSALEAMQQRQGQPLTSSQINFPIHTLTNREATPPWQREKLSQPMTLFVPKTHRFNTPLLASVTSPTRAPAPQKSIIASSKTEVEKFQKMSASSDPSTGQSLVKERTSAFESKEEPRLSVFRLAKAFDEKARRGPSPASTVPVQRSSLSFQEELSKEDGEGMINSPVVSRVMRGPQQQRATFSHQEISSLGANHPSADRIRTTVGAESVNDIRQQSLPFPPISKSHSGDIATPLHVTTSKGFSVPPSGPPLRNKSPPPPNPRPRSQIQFPSSPSGTNAVDTPGSAISSKILQLRSLPTSNPALLNADVQPAKGHVLNQPAFQDSVKRTSSGSSIFDRARSLYISSRDAQGIVAPKPTGQNDQQRQKPPALPRTGSFFPKQYEAQMSPRSADKKQREVEAYFKFQPESVIATEPLPVPPVPGKITIPPRYLKKQKEEEHRIRKSASQGQILNRQRSFSDGEEEENVDQIFESLYKTAVESKLAKTTVSGNRTVTEQAEVKATQSATQSKAVEKTASVEATKTSAGSTSIVKKQSSVSTTSSSYASSTTTAHVSTEKVTSSSGAIEGSKTNTAKSGVANSTGPKIFEYTNPAIKSSANSIKDGLLAWCQGRTRAYKNVNITNFSSSWADGLAFCALLHHFFPNAFDYDTLTPSNRKKNFDLAFDLADKLAGIYPLLETEDMLIMGKNPDYKCIFTYVNAMYLKLKDR